MRRAAATPHGRRQAGFTLIEIIVAFAILALGLTFLLGTMSGAGRQLRQGGDAGRAALHAQSLLDEHAALLRGPLHRAGTLEDGRYRWQLDAAPWQDPAPGAASTPVAVGGARLLRVTLDIEWGEADPQHRLHVASLRLALPVDAGG